MENKLSDLEWDKIRKDSAVRQTIGGNSFYWFFHLYFSHYIEFATADFQKEMFQLASDDEVEHLIVLAFRSSGKSTIITTALPLWGSWDQCRRNMSWLSAKHKTKHSNI